MILQFILKRRELVVCLTLILIAFGLDAYQHLPLEAYPDIANMQVRVITQVPGKAAEEVERLVTIPLEKELNGIPRSKPPRSISIFGLSVITVVFDDDVDPYLARQQTLERISQADVPSNVQPQLDPNASPVGEIYRYTVEGNHWSPMARKEAQDWLLNRKLKSVPGVIDVTGFGGPSKTYQVELDPYRLKALGITQSQVADAIAKSNGSTGGSYIVQNEQDYMVRGLGLLHSVKDISQVEVATTLDGIPIHVHDLATVGIGPAVRKGQVGKNDDDDAVEGIILMRRGENPSRAVDNLMQVWDDVQKALPDGMHLVPLYDRTALVRHTMQTIGHNVAEGIFLVVTLLMVYLFQIRSALICAAVIPLALLTAFILLNTFNVPANLLSLGAIDFGIIVDGAIVMVENICRHLSKYKDRSKVHGPEVSFSVFTAAREVVRPILFATTIILVTFLPVLTFESVEGKLFRPLAITMGFNLIGAVLASMTIIPVLCAIIFSWKPPGDRESPVIHLAEQVYRPVLGWSMRNRAKVVAIAVTVLAGSCCLLPMLGSEFLPELEEGNIWVRVTVLPTSVSLDKAVDIARKIRSAMRSYPEVINVVTQIGSPDDGTDPNTYSNIEVFVDLKPQEEWRQQFPTKQSLVTAMNANLMTRMPGLLYNFSQYIKDNMDETISGVKGELAIKVYGPDLTVLTQLGRKIRDTIIHVPGLVDVASDELLGQPQLMVSIDRDRAARYGINTNDVLDIVETSIGGRVITEVIDDERRFPVVLRFQKGYRSDVEQLADIRVSTPSGQRIPLAQIAEIKEAYGAANILRDENSRRIAIKANIRGRDLGSCVQDAQRLVNEKVKLPSGYRIVWGGQYARAQHAMGRLMIVLPITLGLVFLLLYSAFGSASIACLVMLTVPLAAPGAILALYLTQTHLSISAGVGFIALFGVAVQNGVILVSLVTELQKQGISLREAIAESALVRMRPAIMTTTVAMAGLLPAALSTGIGSQSQRPFAIVIVGGLVPGIILSLMVLPALYEWLSPNHRVPRFPGQPEEAAREAHVG